MQPQSCLWNCKQRAQPKSGLGRPVVYMYMGMLFTCMRRWCPYLGIDNPVLEVDSYTAHGNELCHSCGSSNTSHPVSCSFVEWSQGGWITSEWWSHKLRTCHLIVTPSELKLFCSRLRPVNESCWNAQRIHTAVKPRTWTAQLSKVALMRWMVQFNEISQVEVQCWPDWECWPWTSTYVSTSITHQ